MVAEGVAAPGAGSWARRHDGYKHGTHTSANNYFTPYIQPKPLPLLPTWRARRPRGSALPGQPSLVRPRSPPSHCRR